MTYLAVPITVSDINEAEAAIKQAVSAGAELLELRLDYLQRLDTKDVTNIVATAKGAGLAVIATCRPIWEGGRFAGSEDDRQVLLRQAVKAGADYVDVELAAIEKGPFEPGSTRTIISSHDFKTLPSDFANRLNSIKLRKPDVIKIAYMANRISDSFSALDMLKNEPGSIAVAMSEAGVITRLLAKKLGAFLTFAQLGRGMESAPGQVTIEQMKELYRWDAITCSTKVYGVVASPVGHSLSPVAHNAAFTEVGFDGLYIPLLVEPGREGFERFMDGIRERNYLEVRGLSVTIPHKTNALEYVRACGGELESAAERIGAVNTLMIDSNGKVSGYNTDYAGALDGITGVLGIQRSDLQGLTTAIIGAGGVARAVVAGLTDMAAEVTIYNRTEEKAKVLAEEFGCKWRPLTELQSLDTKLLINCTSIGMHPKTDGTPVGAKLLKKDMVVFDTVYNPLETRLLREAREAGARTVDGMSMFINQAALQFEMFTGKKAPKEVMLRAVSDFLAGRSVTVRQDR